MPPLTLTAGKITKACEMRAYGGSNGACARHAGVNYHTFLRWMHFGEVLRDYLDNDKEFESYLVYRTWRVEAEKTIEKLKRDLEQTKGVLSKEHKLYLKLWDKMEKATDEFVGECHITLDRAKNVDPSWALRGIKWFHPDEYQDQPIQIEGTEEGGAIRIKLVEVIRDAGSDSPDSA